MRQWIKLWVSESLTGTIRFDFTPAERGTWFDLLALAGRSKLNGVIAPGEGSTYPHSWIAATLNIPLKLLEQTLAKCEQSGRIIEDDEGIHIVNWHKYQSEYQRQKLYREKKTSPEDTAKEQSDEILSQLSEAYQREIGPITPLIRQALEDFAAYCRERDVPLEWINDAFKEAATHNVRTWNYVQAILKTWIEQGKK